MLLLKIGTLAKLLKESNSRSKMKEKHHHQHNVMLGIIYFIYIDQTVLFFSFFLFICCFVLIGDGNGRVELATFLLCVRT